MKNAQVVARLGLLSLPCDCPDPAHLPRRSGRWLYGGIGFHHFGHALIFSTARLWALNHLEQPIDGIVFFDRGQDGQTRPGTTRQLQMQMDAFGIDLPVWTIAQPETIDALVVPEQGISTAEALFTGTPEYRLFIRAAMARKPAADPAYDRVYISRTKLGSHKAGLLFEDQLEAYLEQEGYVVFHPQDHSLDRQIAVYKGASMIIGVEGSAMHLAAFAARDDAKVAVLSRRAQHAQSFAAQIEAISGADAYSIAAYGTVYAPQTALLDGTLWFRMICETRFPDLGKQLADLGFISTAKGWKNPPERRLRRRFDHIERRLKQKLVPVPKGHLEP